MNASDPIVLFRSELRAAAVRQAGANRRRHRLMVAAAVTVITVLAAGAALATNAWLTGEPAPPSVIADFNTYTPQLGFHPDPGSAVLVAKDGDSSLYATTNSEGSYCVVVSAPWWRPNMKPDGGTCIGESLAAQQIVAGVVSSSPGDFGSDKTMLVAGRVDVPDATRVTLTAPAGDTITRPLGTSGFFLAAVRTRLCASDWTSSFIVLDDHGRRLAQSAITLVYRLKLSSGGTTCWMPFSSEKGPFMRISTGISSAP